MMDELEIYRQPWETDPHWELKREFIEAYKDMFEEQRLLCLAQAYSNIILLNCWYPDPVIQQIRELSKPLQLHKKFQDINKRTEVKDFTNKPESDKINSVCEQYEKPFKQIKISSNEDVSNSTSVVQSSVEEFMNSHSVPLCGKQDSEILLKSKQTSKTPSCERKKLQEPVFQMKDIFIEREKEDRIISALGLPFIQKFAELAKELTLKNQHSTQLITCICQRLGCKKESYYFKIDVDPDNPYTFRVKFFIKDCEIGFEAACNKVYAKSLCSEIAINTLIKLSTSTSDGVKPNDSVNECKPPVHRISDSMEIFKLFQKNIINTVKDEPALITLKNVASLIDMADCVSFDVVSNTISSTETVHTCKFLLNDILISCAKDEISLGAKYHAADLGIIKLSNLENYEIQEGELKKKVKQKNRTIYSVGTYSSKTSSDVKTRNFEKPPFILNNILYESSLKDNFVMMERDRFKVSIQKDFRQVLAECTNFCRKKLEYQSEFICETVDRILKVKLLIANEVVGVGVAVKKDIAKTIACCRAYMNLKRKYYTLRVKDEYFDGFIVTRNDVYAGRPYYKYRIKKVSMGFINSKIKKKDSSAKDFQEKNLSKPTLKGGMPPRTYSSNIPLFKRNIEKMFKEFSESEDYCDLLFACDFRVSEKIEIFRFAKRLHIQRFHPIHQLVQDNEGNRYMCFRHPYDVRKLIKYLANNEGYNCKFELIDDSQLY